jgi:hypothetical protein
LGTTSLRPVSHHPWLIGKNEQHEHGEVTRPDQELAEEKKEKEPVKVSRSPSPVSNDTKHRDRLEDHGNKIQAVGIVELAELIMMRQPAAAIKKAIGPDGADQGNRGINDRLGFQKSVSVKRGIWGRTIVPSAFMRRSDPQ